MPVFGQTRMGCSGCRAYNAIDLVVIGAGGAVCRSYKDA
jgi:hypothetical protein